MPKSVIYTEMIILQPILTEQSFSFIPRSKTYDGLYLRGESTNIETEITITWGLLRYHKRYICKRRF